MSSIKKDEFEEFVTVQIGNMNIESTEPVIRHTFSTYVSRFYDELPWWVVSLATGAESNTHYIDCGDFHSGFIDDLVGLTAIEFEKNISVPSIYATGFHQVEQYCSSLLNEKTNGDPSSIIGILSDTIRWEVFTIVIINQKDPGFYSAEDIRLVQCYEVDLSSDDPYKINKLETVFSKYIGRANNRELNSFNLSIDFGFNSQLYKDNIDDLYAAISSLASSNPSYFEMISKLWVRFISYLGCSEDKNFDLSVYVDEYYVITIAKLICANILSKKGLISSRSELLSILNGKFFVNRQIDNFVEYDYYGWIDHSNCHSIVNLASTIQLNLSVYNYENIQSQDIFAQIMSSFSQLDKKRLLLGQEYTPDWLASEMVSRSFELLKNDEEPQFLDMCCGSGVFITHILRNTIENYDISSNPSRQKVNILLKSATGFDIDPLAVILSKTNWLLCFQPYLSMLGAQITIPIFHADSLYSRSMVSDFKPDSNGYLHLDLDGECVLIPSDLIQTENSFFFNVLMSSCHDKAMALAEENIKEIQPEQCRLLLSNCYHSTNESYGGDLEDLLVKISELISVLSRLQIENRNGIWSFIFANGYRPGFVSHYFNGIVSNPPWLALSKIHNNPFKKTITELSELLNINGTGSSKLHTELSTIFIINSIHHYLKPDSIVCCILPDSILNGHQHYNFRSQAYCSAGCNVPFSVSEIWDVPKNVFSSKSVVLIGQSSRVCNPSTFKGRVYFTPDRYDSCEFYNITSSDGPVWSNIPSSQPSSDLVSSLFKQGADLMPRTAIFFDTEMQPNGLLSLSTLSHDSDSYYMIKDAKNFRNISVHSSNINPVFLFKCFTSNMVLPFHITEPCDGLLPIRYDDCWKPISRSDIADYGKSNLLLFDQLCEHMGTSLGDYYGKLNKFNKLSNQQFKTDTWVVFQCAGGSHICAAYLKVADPMFLIDQTIYYASFNNESEAIFYTGLLNSPALDSKIKHLQDRGNFGERHVHKIALSITPEYDPLNPIHISFVSIVTQLLIELDDLISDPVFVDKIHPSSGNLQVRRKLLKEKISSLASYEKYVLLSLELLS